MVGLIQSHIVRIITAFFAVQSFERILTMVLVIEDGKLSSSGCVLSPILSTFLSTFKFLDLFVCFLFEFFTFFFLEGETIFVFGMLFLLALVTSAFHQITVSSIALCDTARCLCSGGSADDLTSTFI